MNRHGDPRRTGRFVRDTRSELKKVVWPTREEAINLTLIVIAVSVAMGSALGRRGLSFSRPSSKFSYTRVAGDQTMRYMDRTSKRSGGTTERRPNDGSTKDDREWFVIHTYSGYENKVKNNLEHRIKSMDMRDKIFEVVIPVEDEVEIKDGQRRTVQRKIFPGYVLVADGR